MTFFLLRMAGTLQAILPPMQRSIELRLPRRGEDDAVLEEVDR
jgi:hypothetical protein